MCSSGGGQLDRICRAIEELADRSGTGGSAGAEPGQPAGAEPGQATAEGADGPAAGDDLAARDDFAARLARLAAIWAMIAEADPGLARRLPGYLADPE
jgi:hypothetical protein